MCNKKDRSPGLFRICNWLELLVKSLQLHLYIKRMFIPSVHAMFRRNRKHSFQEIHKKKTNKIDVMYDQNEQLNVCLMAQAHVMTKSIPRGHNFASTSDCYVCFSRDNFYFRHKFTAQRGGLKG